MFEGARNRRSELPCGRGHLVANESTVIVLDNCQDFPDGAPLQSLLPPALWLFPRVRTFSF